jgi:CRISPR-associated protein Csc1
MLFSTFQLTFHENLFYATRESGRLYETGRYLHNYALTYALGLAQTPYYHANYLPNYAQELAAVNQRQIYVTPARPIEISYQLNTFKFANNASHVKMESSGRNVPSYGRAKEIAVGSVFEFSVVHPEPITMPQWVRMGLWQSKARLTLQTCYSLTLLPDKRTEISAVALNPLDVQGDFEVFDLISMPPSSVVDNARLHTTWWQADTPNGKWFIPTHLHYTFNTH